MEQEDEEREVEVPICKVHTLEAFMTLFAGRYESLAVEVNVMGEIWLLGTRKRPQG